MMCVYDLCSYFETGIIFISCDIYACHSYRTTCRFGYGIFYTGTSRWLFMVMRYFGVLKSTRTLRILRAS